MKKKLTRLRTSGPKTPLLPSPSFKKKTKRTNSMSICNPELRDPIASLVYLGVLRPHKLRLTCRFLVECWDHHCYLEGDHSSPYLRLPQVTEDEEQGKEEREEEDDDGGEENSLVHWQCFPCGPFKNRGDMSVILHRDLFLNIKMSFGARMVHLCLIGLRVTSFDALDSLPATIARIEVKRCSKLMLIGTACPRSCPGLKSVHLEDLPKLVTMGADSLSKCPELRFVTYKDLPKFRTICDSWFSRCDSLTSLLLTGADLPALTKIANYCMKDSVNLISVKFIGLHKLKSIGANFVSGCTRLQGVHLEDLPVLAKVEPGFAAKCSNFETLSILGTRVEKKKKTRDKVKAL